MELKESGISHRFWAKSTLYIKDNAVLKIEGSMFISFQRVPLFLELFFNGIFIIVYSLRSLNKLPEYFTDTYSNIILIYTQKYRNILILMRENG